VAKGLQVTLKEFNVPDFLFTTRALSKTGSAKISALLEAAELDARSLSTRNLAAGSQHAVRHALQQKPL
jgi:hypothetical protein